MIEPDESVEGGGFDLGRLFQLFIRGQQATNDALGQLNQTSRQQLHMAQSFSTNPGANQQAYRARQNMGSYTHNPTAGQTTAPPLYNISVLPGGGGQQAQGGPQGTFSGPPRPGPQQSGHTPAGTPTGPAGGAAGANQNSGSAAGATFASLRQAAGNLLGNALRNAVAPPGRGQAGQNGQGGGTPAGTPRGTGQGGIPGMPPTANPGNRRAMPPGGPGGGMYPGGYNPGRYGPYGPYGPYGVGGGGGGGNGGGGGGGGNPALGGNANSDPGDNGHAYGANSGVGKWLRGNIPGVNLADEIVGEVRSQRDKNEYYQNIEGGSNFGGFGERLHEEAYAFTTQGVFSSEEARAAFKGVTRLGYNGRVNGAYSQQGGRQDALNYIYHGKTAYGASIDESLQQLEVLSRNSALSLNQFQKALKDVSDTAGEAGVNAQMARGQLTSLLQTAVSSGYGAGSVSTASNIQMGQTQLGRSYQNLDLTGQMGQQFAYMASSNMGMTYNQYLAMQTTNPLAAAQGRAGENLNLLSQIFTQDEINWLKQKAQAMGGKLDPNSAIQLVPEFEQTFPNHNISVIQSQLAAFGIVSSSDPTEALAYAFNLIAGNNGDLANAQKNATNTKQIGLSAAKTAAGDRDWTKPAANPNLMKDFSTSVKGASIWNDVSFGLFGDSGDSTALATYKGSVSSSKLRNPVIEALLQQVKDPDKAQVIIHTNGGERVVSLADAIKNHPQELSNGDVQFVSGDENNKSVADIVGGSNVTGQNWSAEASKSKDTSGQTLSAWQKANPTSTPYGNGSGAGANGTVIIDLTDTAKQLLRVASTSGAANAEGAPAINPYSYNATR